MPDLTTPRSELADRSLEALTSVTRALPGGGEERTGQAEMLTAVADAIDGDSHLVVQAGTGTGKSLAYLLPVLLSEKRAIIATATKALQDQLANKDLPFLRDELNGSFRYAVLKGRSNYVCRQRLAEIDVSTEQLGFDGLAEAASSDQLERIIEWADDSPTGDRAELDFEPDTKTWAAVSVGPRECPGANRCPQGDHCFAESARRAAAEADVTVVNLHLYGIDVATDGAILTEHDVVVIDEAHQAEDILSSAAGFQLSSGRMNALARNVSSIIADDKLRSDLESAGDALSTVLEDLVGQSVDPTSHEPLGDALDLARTRVERVMNALRKIPDESSSDVKARKLRATQAATALIEDIDAVSVVSDADVAWVEGPDHNPTLNVAPLDLSNLLTENLWPQRSSILTSATLASNTADRLGLTGFDHAVIDVGSPFDFKSQALLYCSAHLPDPRDDSYRDALHDDLESLIVAAGGRTLALFTSWSAMHAAADALTSQLPWPVLVQGELPKQALVDAFAADEETSLFATMSFWQGVDIPGNTLSLVTIDKIPFPRPDDPLLKARRDREGRAAFRTIDLPRAATLVAQGAGRLIRTANDRGVVAVFDPRLARSKSYRWDLINALPPMPRTKDRAEAEAFLRAIRDC